MEMVSFIEYHGLRCISISTMTSWPKQPVRGIFAASRIYLEAPNSARSCLDKTEMTVF